MKSVSFAINFEAQLLGLQTILADNPKLQDPHQQVHAQSGCIQQPKRWPTAGLVWIFDDNVFSGNKKIEKKIKQELFDLTVFVVGD